MLLGCPVAAPTRTQSGPFSFQPIPLLSPSFFLCPSPVTTSFLPVNSLQQKIMEITMWTLKKHCCLFLSYYLFVFFSVIPETKLNPLCGQVPGVLLFQTVTKHPSFVHTQSKPSVRHCDFNDIYEPVRWSLMMRLIDLMAPEMTSIKHKRPIIPARRQMPPLRSTSPRLQRSVSRERFKEFFPVLLSRC